MEIRITARLTINAETAILDPAAGFKEELGAFRAAFEKAGIAYTRSPAELGSTMVNLLKQKGML